MAINTNALRGKIAEHNLTQKDVADELGITPKTFYNKMKRGKFDSDEMLQLSVILNLNKSDAANIFFSQLVT